MVDPTRVLGDFESLTYGALSHMVGLLARVIRANGAVALCRDPSGRQTVFISQLLEDAYPLSYRELHNWPTDPRSEFWRTCGGNREDSARLLDSSNPADAIWCLEIAVATLLPELREDSRCLILSLAAAPVCRVLFVRLHTWPAFEDQDPQRVMRYATQCSHIIRNGFGRDPYLSLGMTGPVRRSDLQPRLSDLIQNLSGTERRVLQRLRMHETERQAAEALGRSPNTIHVHVKSIYRKLRVTKRSELLSLFK